MGRYPTTPLHLYAYLLRKTRLLPANMQGHYRHEIRQSHR
uniref:Hypotheticial protein n=1 Tax=Schistosoma japonicum TaxID=6182 RepID=C1LK47_SCHJA|nr:hypotheticial protein [Schistosoma japonicum]